MSLKSVLENYYTLSNQTQNLPKNQQPILLRRMVNGVRQLEVLSSRSELSVLQRILAYFGFGEASLGNVVQFIQENKFQAQIDKNVLCRIDEKIIRSNAHSWVFHINALVPVKPVTISHFGSGATTMYHPANSTKEKDKAGILDFAYVFHEYGVAYVADGSGHGKPDNREKLVPLWQKFNYEFMVKYPAESLKFKGQEQIEQFMKAEFMALNEKVFTIGTASTFSLAMIVEIEGKKYAASMHVGDSTLLHISKKGKADVITPRTESVRHLELSTLHPKNSPIFFNMRPVESGDRIVGLTDGIRDFLPNEFLYPILQKPVDADLLN
jgi:hypothetical protein